MEVVKAEVERGGHEGCSGEQMKTTDEIGSYRGRGRKT
jgi:hypothetical protein